MPFSVFLLIYIVNKVALRSPINKRTYPTIDGRCINKRIQITEYQVFLFSFFFLRNYGGGFLKVRSTVDGTSTLLPRQSTPRALSLSLSLSLASFIYCSDEQFSRILNSSSSFYPPPSRGISNATTQTPLIQSIHSFFILQSLYLRL